MNDVAVSFDALVDALRAAGEIVRDPDRAVPGHDGEAQGYAYMTELLRLALDLYADADGDAPRFVPFSTPTPYHAGRLAIRRVQGGANPDGMYDFAVLRPDRRYRISGRRGSDCYFSLSFSGGRDGEWPDRTVTTLNDRQISFGPDGAFDVVVSADEPGPGFAGSWVRMEPDVCSVIVRQYFLEAPADRVPATMAIEVLDDGGGRREAEQADVIARRIAAAAAFVRSTNAVFPFPAGMVENGFTDALGYSGEAGALGTTDNAYCMGRWRLVPGERLVVEATPPPCAYWSLQAWNHWGQSLTQTIDDDTYRRLIVNRAHATTSSDGRVRIVLGGDVGDDEPNRLDTFGWTHGVMIFRFLYPEARPETPVCTVEATEGSAP